MVNALGGLLPMCLHKRTVSQSIRPSSSIYSLGMEKSSGDSSSNVLRLPKKRQRTTYGDPLALEHRVDARIEDVLQQLQHGAQQQARAFAETPIADQFALSQLVDQRMHAAVLDMEQEINLRVEKHLQGLRRDIADYVIDQLKLAVQRADDNTRTLMNDELQDQQNM
ncbi:hypothetical protein F444_22646 [Phytophthora nicotianae P1976]|uniref:Uncharacterized protein n=1 Tax=Phytophthora nicotianae P1976 TaxID=1317066 RepID=A0A080YX68_PHYNI|nr:hypothetical protein F444_22646 [Phytophthora nicotianae P1976]